MTEKLFYQDPYIKTFDALITENTQDENGTPYVVLDQTVFYPTGGGQPCDLGTLNNIKVTGVETVDGKVVHYLEQPLKGEKVKGEIDWNRRYDHMQQHSGQHILSAAFQDTFGLKTISFHLGAESVTIDLETNSLSDAQAREAEHVANSIVFQNKPIQTVWVEQEDLVKYPIRKQPKVTENIRLVIIEGYDYNACGGTHPSTTGEVGPIHILNWEKSQKGIRVQFLCGWRAISAFADKQDVILNLTRKLSSAESELPEKLDQLLAKQHELEKHLKDAEEKLLKHEAQELIDNAKQINNIRLVARSFIGRDISECQLLSRLILDLGNDVATLFTTKNDGRLHIIGARSTDINDINMRDLIQKGLELINGRGGGKPERAQGGAESDLTAEGTLAYLVDLLEKEKIAQ